MRFPLPLRITIPATLFLFGIFLGGLSFVYEITSSYRRIEEQVARRAASLGNQISGVLEHNLSNDETSAAELQIRLLGSNPNLQLAVVCDDEDRVIFSTRDHLRNQLLTETELRECAPRVDLARKMMRSESAFSADRKAMHVTFPFRLPSFADAPEHLRWGVLYIQYDLALLKHTELTDATTRSVIIAAIVAGICLFIWFFFHRTLTRRVTHLLAATRRVAEGDYTPVKLDGSDELAFLAQAFDRMVENIRSRTAELELANQKMKREIADRELAENRFLSVWKSSVDGMRLTDHHGHVVAVNEAYCRMAGMSAEEIEGKPFTVCYKAEEAEEMLETYRTRFANRSIETFIERQVKFRCEKSADLEVASSFIAQDNHEPLLLSIFRDVTERKRAQELLYQQAASMEASIDGMAILNEGGMFIYVNEAHAKIYGFEAPEQLLGRSWEDLYAENELCRFKEYIMPTMFKTGRWHGEATGRKRDGTSFPQELSLSRIESGGLVCVARDITERKQDEERRLAIDRKLLDAQKLESLGVLAGGIAHDFNNLLTAVLGNASLALLQSSGTSTARPFLANIEKTSLQAAELCKQMLAYSGRGKFVIQRIDLNALIVDMQHLFQISVNKRVTLKLDLAHQLPAIEGDPSQMRQVIMNLVINGSEAIGDQNGVVSVTTGVLTADRRYFAETYLSPDLAEGSYVFVEVSDSGCGMSAETKAKIFEPFFTTKFTGRGLGLAAVLGIVRGHKGALKVYSEPGHGSTFKCLIPMADAPADAVEADVPSPDWIGEGTILVVDDEETVRTVTSQMLEIFGFDVIAANDGREGVEQFSRNVDRITAVVLDMTMPHMNGEEAFREIQRIRPNTPVVLISGYNEQDATNRFAGKGLAGFLQKPFRLDDLRRKIRSVLQAYEAKSGENEIKDGTTH